MTKLTSATAVQQHVIDPEICIRCNTCEETCPIDAISHDANNYVVDAEICLGCRACISPCPTGAIDNWLTVLSDQACSVTAQFGWLELPVPGDLPDCADAVVSQLTPAALAAQNADEPAFATPDAGVQSGSGLDGIPSTLAGASIPPASAAAACVNLYTHDNPATATVVGNYRVTSDDTESDIHHIVLDFGSTPFPVLEGQSIAIFPPGADAAGRAYNARQYSVASPRDGERPRYNNLALTVKRVTADFAANPVHGVCSNYLCDLEKNDTVQVIGPFGNTFLMPDRPDANLIMICTGTGSAPMRAMTERCRRRVGKQDFDGKLMLFFGARSAHELPYFGPLMNLPDSFIDVNLAFSREPGRPRQYVQDLIRERAADVFAMLEMDTTCLYVCGLKGMEAGVIEALRDVVTGAGGQWPDVHEKLKLQGRLHFETY